MTGPANDNGSLRALVLELQVRVARLEARPLTVAQAAEQLGVTQKTIRRRIEAGTLASSRTGRRVVVHLDRDPVADLLAS
ncbi:MAG: excisionase family DNA-binding protein [Myxococcales bacterium]